MNRIYDDCATDESETIDALQCAIDAAKDPAR